MSKNNLTDITMIIDRSGSMYSCQVEAESGVNLFIDEQKKSNDKSLFTLIQFNNDCQTVHSGIKMKDVPPFSLRPGGMTAMLDAVGLAISEAKDRIEKMPKKKRPNLVIMAILTDGEENCSSEYTLDQINKLIVDARDNLNWQFTFLGANQDAFETSYKMGISASATSNYSVGNSVDAFSSMSASILRTSKSVMSGKRIDMSYTKDERDLMTGKSK